MIQMQTENTAARTDDEDIEEAVGISSSMMSSMFLDDEGQQEDNHNEETKTATHIDVVEEVENDKKEPKQEEEEHHTATDHHKSQASHHHHHHHHHHRGNRSQHLNRNLSHLHKSFLTFSVTKSPRRASEIVHQNSTMEDSDDEEQNDSTIEDDLRFDTTILIPALLFVGVLILGCYVLPALLVPDLELIVPVQPEDRFEIWVVSLSTIPIGLFLVYAANECGMFLPNDYVGSPEHESQEAHDNYHEGRGIRNDNKNSQEDEENKRLVKWAWAHALKDRLRLSQTPVLLFVTVLCFQARQMATVLVKKELQYTAHVLLNRALGMALFSAYLSLLADTNLFAIEYADRLDSAARESVKREQNMTFLKNMARFGDYDVDKAFVVPGGFRSPAHVLAEIVSVYCNIGKFMGVILLVMFFAGIDVTSNLVVIGLTVVFAAIVRSLGIGEAITHVLPLAMSNAFHVGEIVSVSKCGREPGDNPGSTVVGFVEGVTWGYVIIRDFKRKPTFIPYSALDDISFANWSRRPSKLIHFRVQVTPGGLSGGAAPLAKLAKICRGWVKAHPLIDSKMYQKSAIRYHSHSGNMILQVIFYPHVGEKSRNLKSEFLVMVMEAAKRLNICVTPTEVRSSRAWEGADQVHCNYDDDDNMDQDDESTRFSDLMPSEKLTYKSGLVPKVKRQ